MSQNKKPKKSYILSPYYWFGAFIFVVMIIFISVLFYSQKKSSEEELYKQTQENYVLELNQEVDGIFRNVISDIRILSKYKELNRFLENGDDNSISDLSQEFLDFARFKGIYDQVRFIDENGIEVIRVNYNNGKPTIVGANDLQDKSQRYYFKDSFMLEENEVFVSPFDLNIEGGKIEDPLKPMIRVATPVFLNGEKKGVIILNYLGDQILSSLTHAVNEGIEINFLNQDGYWLYSSRGKDDWAFMYDDRLEQNLLNTNKEVWESISFHDERQFFDNGDLYTSAIINPYVLAQYSSSGSNKPYSPSLILLDPIDYKWVLYTKVPKNVLYDGSSRLLFFIVLIDTILFLMATIIMMVLSRSAKQKHISDKEINNLNDILQIINKILRHDLANSLTAIKATLEIYKEDQSAEVFANADGAVASGIRLINKMRQLESAMSHKKERELLAIEEVVKAATKGMKIELNVTGTAMARVDQALEVVMKNLVSNAIRHGGAKKIDVTIVDSKIGVKIDVADNGSGIPDNIKSEIFEEGFKSGSTGNTGLGLYIVQKTVERYGGSISVTDNIPKGAKFSIELPK